MELFFIYTGFKKDKTVVDTYMNREIENRKMENSSV